jgi:hypothetical protein
MANNISVAVGDNETMARGRAGICTVPLAATMDAGNDPVEGVAGLDDGVELLLQAARSRPSDVQTAIDNRRSG